MTYTATDLADYLHFTWRKGYPLNPAIATVKVLANNDPDLLGAVSRELNMRLPDRYRVPVGQATNTLIN